MTNLEAKRRYFRVFIPAMAVFLLTSGAIAWMGEDNLGASPAVYAVAMVPTVAQIALFLAHLRFISEIDEYLRTIQTQAVLFGLAVILCIATGWGYLEALADVPRLHILWLNPIYWIAYGVASTVLSVRATGRSA